MTTTTDYKKLNHIIRLSPETTQLGEEYDRLFSRDIGGTRITCKRNRTSGQWVGMLTGLSCERYRVARIVVRDSLSECVAPLMAGARLMYPRHYDSYLDGV